MIDNVSKLFIWSFIKTMNIRLFLCDLMENAPFQWIF